VTRIRVATTVSIDVIYLFFLFKSFVVVLGSVKDGDDGG
jgi:hypothetical protein